MVHEWSRVLTCIDSITNSLFVRTAPRDYPVFLVFRTGEVFQKTFSFYYGSSSPCWTEERRCQHLVGGHHTVFLQNVFEGTAKLRRLSRRHLRCKWQSFLFLSADNAKPLGKSTLHRVLNWLSNAHAKRVGLRGWTRSRKRGVPGENGLRIPW